MNRKDFLVKTSLTTAGFILLPTDNLIRAFSSNDNSFIPIDAFKKDYQNLIATTKSAVEATKITLETNNAEREFYGSMAAKIDDTLKRENIPALTPPVAYKQKKKYSVNHSNHGVLFSDRANKEAGYFVGPEKVYQDAQGELQYQGEYVFVVYSSFLMYTQLDEYFCYGKPSSHPLFPEKPCKYCGGNFVEQRFFYPGDSVYERNERTFTHNPFCLNRSNPNINGKGQVLHAGIDNRRVFSDILPCKIKENSPCSKTFEMTNYNYRK